MKLLDGIISWDVRRPPVNPEPRSRVEVDVTDDGEVMVKLDVHDVRCTFYLRPDDAADFADQIHSAAREGRAASQED